MPRELTEEEERFLEVGFEQLTKRWATMAPLTPHFCPGCGCRCWIELGFPRTHCAICTFKATL